VLPFTGVGADPEAAAVARGLSAWIGGRFRLVEEATNGEVWAVVPDELGSGDLDDLRKTLGVTAALGGQLAATDTGWQLRLRVVDSLTGKEVDSAAVRVDRTSPCSLAVAAAQRSLRLLGVALDPSTASRFSAGLPGSESACTAYLEGLGWRVGAADQAALEAAIGDLERAAAEDGDHVPTLVAAADAYRELFAMTADQAWLRLGLAAAGRALEVEDRDPQVWLALARLQREADEPDQAIASLERASALGPSSTVHSELGRQYRAADRLEDAERAFQRAIRLRPGDTTLHINLGHLYYGLGQRDAAVTQFREALECAPENALAASNLCGVYLAFDLRPQARQMCERSLELERNFSALSNLGFLAFAESNFGEAMGWFEEALETGEGDYRVWGNLGFAYHYMDRRRDARVALSRAIELGEDELRRRSGEPWLLLNLGSYHAVLGDRQRALELLDVAAAGGETDDGMFMAGLAEAYEDAGERELALQWLRRAVAVGLPPAFIENSPTLRKVQEFRDLVPERGT
jgi:tetratricopeptide (TPR) repeat protein